MRRPYEGPPLVRADLDPDPIVQFQAWFTAAQDALAALPDPYRHPNVCTLATANAHGVPSARVVLLKGVDARGFRFFTDRSSEKGRDLAENAVAALVFHWAALERQVRVQGPVCATAREEDDRYFASRPRTSQLSAAASSQSSVIANREALEQQRDAIAHAMGSNARVPVPPRWGGYRVEPARVEFWQGRPDRLHDRFVYERTDAGYRIARLQP